jgi:hypothetical protein
LLDLLLTAVTGPVEKEGLSGAMQAVETGMAGFEKVFRQGAVRYFQSAFSSGKLVLKV